MDVKAVIGNLKQGNHGEFVAALLKRYYAVKGYEYAPIWEKEWDVLLVLDGCRLDLAREVITSHEVEFYRAPGSCSMDWAKHFTGSHDDIVYVSGNPHVSPIKLEDYLGGNPFHKLYEVWDDGWDDDLGTVPPGPVNEALRKAADKHPEKRIIAHYMQPHHPFIGSVTVEDSAFEFPEEVKTGPKGETVWHRLQRGEVELEAVKQAYRSNLEYVLSEIEPLLPELDGTVVATADHGNLLGEWGMYGHPCGVYLPELVEVPWITMSSDNQ